MRESGNFSKLQKVSCTYDRNFLVLCNHSFCKKCITTWKNYNNNCPICRSILLNDPFFTLKLITFHLKGFGF